MTHYAWLQPTLERIADLLKMPHWHNSYGTPKVDASAALCAVQFLAYHMPESGEAPTIVPTIAAGLLMKWNGLVDQYKLDFEPGAVTASYNKQVVRNLEEATDLFYQAMVEPRKDQDVQH